MYGNEKNEKQRENATSLVKSECHVLRNRLRMSMEIDMFFNENIRVPRDTSYFCPAHHAISCKSNNKFNIMCHTNMYKKCECVCATVFFFGEGVCGTEVLFFSPCNLQRFILSWPMLNEHSLTIYLHLAWDGLGRESTIYFTLNLPFCHLFIE